MTATDPAPLVCPQCGSTNTSVGGSGSGMCFECAHMWDPANVVALPRPTVADFAMATVEEVYGERLAELTPPDPHDYLPSWEGLRAFREAGGSIPDELWWSEIMHGAPDDLDPHAVQNDEPPAEVQAVLLLSQAILDAGLRAARLLSDPSFALDAMTGYLPDDADLLPLVEQACAVAIGRIIDAFDIDPAEFGLRLSVGPEDVTQGDPTMEETNGEGSTEKE